MKCETCGEEFVNSIELDKHKEREHPTGDDADENLEKPDMLQDQAQPAPIIPGKN